VKTQSAQKILSAAEELFAAHGFDKVSVRDIAEHAKVNKALVFYYYDSKATLLERVLDGYYREHARALKLPVATDPRSGLHELIDRYIDFIESNRPYLDIVQREAIQGADGLPAIRRGLQALFDQVESLFKGTLPDKGPLASKHFFVTIAGMVTAYFGYAPVLSHLWDGEPMDEKHQKERREHIHWVIDNLLSGLQTT
jgi:AcrR family transcriptional regulator